MKKKAEHISRIDKYEEFFLDDNKSKSERMRSGALREALDIRKFEIELQWKRTGYFWAFITVISTALFTLLCKYLDCPCKDVYCKYEILVPVISTLAGLLFFFATAWHMVNKASKFWQENWEKHVSLLEEKEIGPLYDVYLNPNQPIAKRLAPCKAFDFSVSKVNMCASFTITILSLLTCVGIVLYLVTNNLKDTFTFFSSIIPAGTIVLATLYIFFIHQGNKIDVLEDEDDELDMVKIKH